MINHHSNYLHFPILVTNVYITSVHRTFIFYLGEIKFNKLIIIRYSSPNVLLKIMHLCVYMYICVHMHSTAFMWLSKVFSYLYGSKG